MDDWPIDAWTAYWRAGRSASCFEGTAAEVRFRRVWEDLVDLLDPGSRLLDLATGNGTVARSCAARAQARGIDLCIDAVDAAAIDPRRHVTDPDALLKDIRFHGGVRLEALPFTDQSFDCVVSQFGFEYADEPRAAAEAIRVMAPGGRLRLVLHARDGAVAADIGRRLGRLGRVMADTGPVTLVRTLARAADAGDAAAIENASAHLDAAANLTRELARRPPPDDAALFYASEFLKLWSQRARYWPADLRRSVEDGWMNAAGVAERQKQMLDASRSAADVERLAARLAGAGMLVDPPIEIRDERRAATIAWRVDARKPSRR